MITDIKTVDLTARAVPEDGYTIVYMGEALTAQFGVTASDLSDFTSFRGEFIRPDGATVTVAGTISGTTASVTLPAKCFYYEGAFTLALILYSDTAAQVVRFITGIVKRTTSDILADSDNTYDLSTLAEEIAEKMDEPESEGSSGQVLTTDGNGGRSWQNVSTVTAAGRLTLSSTNYILRTGTAGAAGYITFVLE